MIVLFSKTSLSYLGRLEKPLRKRIVSAIDKLPDHGDIKRLKGKKLAHLYRLRIGKYRIIYRTEAEILKILDIDTRGDIY
jgi:mRNA-degrading endonuclease RelE of RelBE toxin-antitoxin system